MTPLLDEECRRMSLSRELDGFRIAPKMLFQGRWVRHCTDYPAFQARFVRAPQFRFIQVGHGQREAPEMKVANLEQNYLHDLSIYGAESWLEKHRRYARAEAARILHADSSAAESWIQLLSPQAIVRRRALKRLSFKFPFRPTLRFVYQYLLRGGFLDGSQGLRYCLLLARYEGFISDEIANLRRRGNVAYQPKS
jgi:hypothetical protein